MREPHFIVLAHVDAGACSVGMDNPRNSIPKYQKSLKLKFGANTGHSVCNSRCLENIEKKYFSKT